MLGWFLLFACVQEADDAPVEGTTLAEEQAERRALDPSTADLPPLPASLLSERAHRLPAKAPRSALKAAGTEDLLDEAWAERRNEHPGGSRTVSSVRAESHVWWCERYLAESRAYLAAGEVDAARRRAEDALEHYAYGDAYLQYAATLQAADAPSDAAEAYRIAMALEVDFPERASAARAAALCSAQDPEGAWLAAGVATLEGAGPLETLAGVDCLGAHEQASAFRSALARAATGEVRPGRWVSEDDSLDLCDAPEARDAVIVSGGEPVLTGEEAVAWILGIDPPDRTREGC